MLGSIICAFETSKLFSFAIFKTSSLLPINTTLQKSCFEIKSTAFNVLISVAYGNTIVFLCSFALFIISSKKAIYTPPYLLTYLIII